MAKIIADAGFSVCVRCLICGEGVPIYSPSDRGCYKICDKCKEAVMYIRDLKQLHSDTFKPREGVIDAALKPLLTDGPSKTLKTPDLEGDWVVNSDPDKGPC